MGISTHVLDTSLGRPAAGVGVGLERLDGAAWVAITEANTDADGRVPSLLPRDVAPETGVYRLRFATAAYFARIGVDGLYPSVEIQFVVRAGEQHCHLPLLLTANSYTTYRGS